METRQSRQTKVEVFYQTHTDQVLALFDMHIEKNYGKSLNRIKKENDVDYFWRFVNNLMDEMEEI